MALTQQQSAQAKALQDEIDLAEQAAATAEAKAADARARLRTLIDSFGPLPPVITSFTLSPAAIKVGQSTTITAAWTDGTSATLNGQPVASFPVTLFPVVDTDYVLTVDGPGGTVSSAPQHVAVSAVVVPPPPPLPAGVGIPVIKHAQRPTALILAVAVPDGVGHMVWVGFHDGGRYNRGQNVAEANGAAVRFRLFPENGFTMPPIPNAALTLDGVVIATGSCVAGAAEIIFTVDATRIKEGHYFASVTGAPDPWTVLDYPVYVRQGKTALPQQYMKVVNASYDHVHHDAWLTDPADGKLKRMPYHRHISATLPAVYKALELSLPARTYPPIANVPSLDQLVVRDIAVFRPNDVYRPNVTATGVWSTANRQDYFWSDVHAPRPLWPLLDGPRGRGTQTCVTGIVHTERPDPTSTKVVTCDPWRVGTVIDGVVKTLAGYLHDEPPPHLNFEGYLSSIVPAPRLVGDWSAIPVNLRGFQGLWDVIVDHRTTTLDPNAAPIGGEQPHPGDVRFWVCDYKRNRVCLLTFSGQDRTAPCKVTKFCDAVGPWNGCVGPNGELVVSKRDGHTVDAHDPDTGAVLWSVPIQQPEGCRYQDGYYYIGSNVTKTIWRIDATTHAVLPWITGVEVVKNDGNAVFINLALSDGTAGPRGAIWVMNWSNGYYGFPMLYVDQKRVDYLQLRPGTVRRGPPAPGWGDAAPLYTNAVAASHNRITFGGVNEGLLQISAVLPTDDAPPAAYFVGLQKYRDCGYELTNSRGAMSLNGLAPPWGVDPDIDIYLARNGHIKP